MPVIMKWNCRPFFSVLLQPVSYCDLLRNSQYFRWRNWIIRGIFTWVMICGFGTVILLGPLYIVLLVGAVGEVAWLCMCSRCNLTSVDVSAWLIIVSYTCRQLLRPGSVKVLCLVTRSFSLVELPSGS